MTIENVKIVGLEETVMSLYGQKDLGKSDSGFCKGGDDGIGCINCANEGCGHPYDKSFQIGKKDLRLMSLMVRLVQERPVQGMFRRMIIVYAIIDACKEWWYDFFDTYHERHLIYCGNNQVMLNYEPV